jgi:hypothetical protein
MGLMAEDYIGSIKIIKAILKPGLNESIPKNLFYSPTTSENNSLLMKQLYHTVNSIPF